MNSRAFSSQFSTQRLPRLPVILKRANITLVPSRRPVPGVRRQIRRCSAILASASAAASAAAPAAVSLPQAYGYVWCLKRFNLHKAQNLVGEMSRGFISTQILDGFSGFHSCCGAVDGLPGCKSTKDSVSFPAEPSVRSTNTALHYHFLDAMQLSNLLHSLCTLSVYHSQCA